MEPAALAGPERQAHGRFWVGKVLVIAKAVVALTTLISASSMAFSRLNDVRIADPEELAPDAPPRRLEPEENPELLWTRTLDSTPQEQQTSLFGVSWRRSLSARLMLSNEDVAQTGLAPAVKATVGGVPGFPPLEKSALLFMHVFKCAGSTLRRLMVRWAEVEGYRGAVVVECGDVVSPEGKVCLHRYQLLDERVQEAYIAQQRVLAGHFIWGFQRHLPGSYLMVTTLRNPLELFVSAQQYIFRRETKTLPGAVNHVTEAMRRTLKTGGPGAAPGTWVEHQREAGWNGTTAVSPPAMSQRQVTGYIRRFVGLERKVLFGEALVTATTQARTNLEKFWLVGVVEQYAGFLEVLRRMLDPNNKHAALWDEFSQSRYNQSPVRSSDVLAAIEPQLVHEFNASLALQWSLYDKAVELWTNRCEQVLPSTMREELCPVRRMPASYGVAT